MYKISKDKRKYSTTPIAMVVNGKEIPVLYSRLPKKEGDAFMEKIVKLLNKKELEPIPRPIPENYLIPYLTDEYLPHESVEAANAVIPTPERYIGLIINIKSVNYWYKSGIEDKDLIKKED